METLTQNLLRMATPQRNLTDHADHRILKLTRTVCKLIASDLIGLSHVTEAVHDWPRESAKLA